MVLRLVVAVRLGRLVPEGGGFGSQRLTVYCVVPLTAPHGAVQESVGVVPVAVALSAGADRLTVPGEGLHGWVEAV